MKNYDFFTCFPTKTITVILTVIVSFCIGIIIFLFSVDLLWPEYKGSKNLGNGLYLLDWDGGSIIVKGENIHGKTCYGGEYIIPVYNCRYDSVGNVNEYVVKEKHNDKWILVKVTILTPAMEKYYLIDKSFNTKCSAETITKKFITSFSDSSQFFNYIHSHNIEIEW